MSKKESTSVKQEIANAFMELMTQKSYMDITVTDLVNTAKVARVSFYRNFNSISDVIDYIIDQLSYEFVEDILPTLNSRDERKWREFLFEYFYNFARKHRKAAAASFAGSFGRYHAMLRSQLASPLKKFCKDGFGPDFIAEALLTWTMAGTEFDEIYSMIQKLF